MTLEQTDEKAISVGGLLPLKVPWRPCANGRPKSKVS
jgi:hypothetical protein